MKLHPISLLILLAILSAACVSPQAGGAVINTTPTAPAPIASLPPSPVPTPESAKPFSLDTVTSLDPTLKTALQAYAGLEASITPEANGQFTANVTVLTSEGQPTTAPMTVTPETMTQDLTSKNKYGDTPVMTLADGSKLYWIQEEKAWFEVKVSPDINKPVLIPYGKTEIATRVVIAEFPQPFSQEAVDWWKKTPGFGWDFMLLVRNANTGETTKFGYLRNDALGEPSLTTGNSPVQLLNAWFAMDFPDGSRYEFSPTKWFDPPDPRNPKGDEWKILFATSGPEVMGSAGGRKQYDNLYTLAAGMKSHQEIVPVFIAQPGFFDSASPLITLSTGQPSLEKLLGIPSNSILNTMLPDGSGMNYKTFFNMHFPNLSLQNAGFSVGWSSKDDPAYSHEFIPADAQEILVPALIIQH